jgi:3-(3-hydroxy-phenyl)propionate hydroxylase
MGTGLPQELRPSGADEPPVSRLPPGENTRYGVVIIGAGPTGLTLANLLGVEGVRTLLVERNPTTVDEPRAVSIDDEALRTMQAAGLVEEVLSTVVPGYGYHYLSPTGRRFASVDPTLAPYGYPRRSAFRQPVLERLLRAGLARFSHVETWFGHTLDTFHQDDRGVTVRARGPDGRRVEVECDYLVGCDGANSTVRHLLGIPLEGSSFSERWLIVDLEQSEVDSRHTLVFCDPARPGIALPGPDRTRRFEFKLYSHERDQDVLSPHAVQQLLARHGADPRSVVGRTVVYRFHARVAARWTFDRVLLAGDAAHLSPPFAGQGMNSGIRDAHNLAWKLAAVLRGRIGSGLLETYEAERRPHVWGMIRLALRMGRIMAPRSRLEAAAVEVTLRLLSLYPPIRDYFAEMRWRPAPHFSSGFLVSDGRGSRQTLVGRLLPQPWVVTGDGRATRLDTVLGNRFALLAWTARPRDALAQAAHPVWDRLDAKRVVVVSPGTGGEAVSGLEAVWDRDGVIAAALAGYPEHVLLLRPDHYVAACVPVAELRRGAETIGALVGRAWEPRMSRIQTIISST